MKIATICVGSAKTRAWRGEEVRTAIYKDPVDAADIHELGLSGDQQADLQVHGGPDKAVYGYSADHYPWWKTQLPAAALPHGVFGENLTLDGYDEGDACLGDVYRAGTAELLAIQPRLPCSKLALRFDDPGMVKRFAQSLRLGTYFRVVKPGRVSRGDAFVKISKHAIRYPVLNLARLYFDPALTQQKARPALEHPSLNGNWRQMLGSRLNKE